MGLMIDEIVSKKEIGYYTLEGRRILPFFLSLTTDGFSFGFPIKEFENIHHTLINKENRISWHIKDETKFGSKPPRFGGYEPEKIKNFIEKRTKSWIRKYHGNKKCWQLRKYLIKKIFKYLPKKAEDGVIEYPIELIFGRIELDLENKKRWKRIKLKKLIGKGYPFAIIFDDDKYKWVEQVTESHMVCYTNNQFLRFQDDLIKLLGFTDYFEYLNKRLGDKIKDEIERRMKQQSKS